MGELAQVIAKLASTPQRQVAESALASLPRPRPNTTTELIALAENERCRVRTRMLALELLRTVSRPAEVGRVLVRIIRSPCLELAVEATNQLRYIRYHRAVPLLIRNLRNSAASLQSMSASVLGGLASAAALQPLMDTARDEKIPLDTRCWCIEALSGYISAEEEVIQKIVAFVEELAVAKEPEIRFDCAYVLSHMALAVPCGAAVLIELSGDYSRTPWGQVRKFAVAGLSTLRSTSFYKQAQDLYDSSRGRPSRELSRIYRSAVSKAKRGSVSPRERREREFTLLQDLMDLLLENHKPTAVQADARKLFGRMSTLGFVNLNQRCNITIKYAKFLRVLGDTNAASSHLKPLRRYVSAQLSRQNHWTERHQANLLEIDRVLA